MFFIGSTMKIHTHATLSATLCILYLASSSADVNPQRHRSDEAVSWKRRRDTTGFGVEERVEELTKSMEYIKQNYERLNEELTAGIRQLEKLEENFEKTITEQGDEHKKIIGNFRKELEEAVAGFRSKLNDLKHDVGENTNAVYQKCVLPLETLNQTVQQRYNVYEDLSQQVAELREEQKRQAAAAFENFELSYKMKEALEDMSQLKEDYISKVAELRKEQERQAAAATETFEISNKMKEAMQEMSLLKENHSSKADLRDKRAITNKCSLNVHHKPEGGRVDFLMVMDPPDIEPAQCN